MKGATPPLPRHRRSGGGGGGTASTPASRRRVFLLALAAAAAVAGALLLARAPASGAPTHGASAALPPAVARAHAALDALLARAPRETVAASLRAAAAGGEAVSHAEAALPDAALVRAATDLLAAAFGPPAHCARAADPTLPPAWGDLTGGSGGGAPAPILLAANLRDAGDVAPHWVGQALALAARAPPGTVFVSVYESGSGDATPAWLGLAARLFAAGGVPATVVARGGGEARPPGVSRIAHLASLRNRALAPLWSAAAATAGRASASASAAASATPPAANATSSSYLWPGLSDEAYAAGGGTPAAAAAGDGSVRRRAADAPTTATTATPATFRPARVLFVNDVFWCAGDAVRLLLTGAASDAALACGLDLYPDGAAGAVVGGRRVRGGGGGGGRAGRGAPAGGAAPFAAGARPPLFRRWAGLPSSEIRPSGPRGPPLSEAGRARPHDSLLFYDGWVARDAAGLPFASAPPFLAHQASRLRLEAGLPFPASCCWNGLANLDAAPFVDGGYRFRAVAPPPGRGAGAAAAAAAAAAAGAATAGGPPPPAFACPASECSLLCEDWTRAGAAPRVVVDPGVRLAYERGAAAAASPPDGPGLPTVPATRWAAVRAAPPVDFGTAPRRFHMTCCPVGGEGGGGDAVHWEECGPGGLIDRVGGVEGL